MTKSLAGRDIKYEALTCLLLAGFVAAGIFFAMIVLGCTPVEGAAVNEGAKFTLALHDCYLEAFEAGDGKAEEKASYKACEGRVDTQYGFDAGGE